jgi:hypothetical protein
MHRWMFTPLGLLAPTGSGRSQRALDAEPRTQGSRTKDYGVFAHRNPTLWY